MHRHPLALAALLAATTFAPGPAFAVEALQLSHAGYVLGANDEPLDASAVPLAFVLWDAETAGNQIWPATGAASCTQAVRSGYYAVRLGDGACGTGLVAEHLPPGAPRWLSVSVDGVVLAPRVRLDVAAAAALAGRALDADKLGGLARAGFVERTDDLAQARYDATLTLTQKLGQFGPGTVTSVGLTLPAAFTVTGSPVTTNGSLAVAFASQAQGTVLAAPSAGPGLPAFRALSTADLSNATTALVAPGGNALGAPLTLGTTDAQPLELLTQSATRVHVTAAGRVGIGTAAPKTLLDVNGGVRVGAMGDGECTSATEGSLRYVSAAPKRLQLCNGTAWSNVSGTPDGTNAANAAFSCKSLKDSGFSTGDGSYWITAPGVATNVYCDMSTDGGGWTLVGFSLAGTTQRNMYSLKCGGGTYHPTNRNDSGVVSYLKGGTGTFARYTLSQSLGAT